MDRACRLALETRFQPLADHRPLKPGKDAGERDNELAHRGRRVDGLLVQIQSLRRRVRGVGSYRVERSGEYEGSPDAATRGMGM